MVGEGDHQRHDHGAGQRGVDDLEQREAVPVRGGAEDADDQGPADRRYSESRPGGPGRQRDDRPQQVPGLDDGKEQHRGAERDAEAADRMQPAAEHRQQQPGDDHHDDADADAAGQRQDRGGVVAEPQQDAHLAGAQRQQGRWRHPTAHHIGGAQGRQPPEAQTAGPADERHHRQRQHPKQAAGQEERPDRATPTASQRHRHEAQCQQRRQLHLRGQRDEYGAQDEHGRRCPPLRGQR